MSRTVLITGTHTLLASALATQYRTSTDDLVLIQAPENIKAAALPRIDDVWWLYGASEDIHTAKTLLLSLSALGVRTFNVVGPIPRDVELEVVEYCETRQIQYIVFHVAHLLDEEVPSHAPGQNDMLRFLHVVDSVVSEVEARLPGYFRRQPLRCLVPDKAAIELADVNDVADALLSISRTNPSSHHHYIVAANPTRFAELCKQVGQVWNLDLAVVTDDRMLNAVDRYFQDRLSDINLFAPRPANLLGALTYQVPHLTKETLGTLLGAFRRRCAEIREADKAKVATMAESLELHSIAGIPGLNYLVEGQNRPPLVIINAIGQGIAIWLPLLERLSRRQQVILWEMRQTHPNGDSVTFAEHCDDLHAVLQQEGIETCHLLGWCTGAKLAARYCRTHPGVVQSMVFLSGSFKHPGRAPEFDTPYERNLEMMCRAIVRQPSVAERLRVLFDPAASEGSSEIDHLDGDELASRALSGLHRDLGDVVRQPFRDVSSLIVYAQQHVEFWSHDETATGLEVGVPVLGIAGEHDRIVSPRGLKDALSHFPLSRYVEIMGSTHYCLYERPDLVADLVEDFMRHTESYADVQFSFDSQPMHSVEVGR